MGGMQLSLLLRLFRECASEEQAIDWIKDLIEKNEKMDKNLISIVRAPFGCQF